MFDTVKYITRLNMTCGKKLLQTNVAIQSTAVGLTTAGRSRSIQSSQTHPWKTRRESSQQQ